ncbi:hypothetical protein PR048_012072 [Dryococelus australis]|uniref:Uncharacterized protein n=1 Tax=Dryococelus australis TaxID=614101 RepID=A0ABQ9HNE6_9NEOP|nr:hypothetical protein PR048_012072 [Dryococelus australis]
MTSCGNRLPTPTVLADSHQRTAANNLACATTISAADQLTRIATALIEHVFSRFGVPLKLYCDQELNFLAVVFREASLIHTLKQYLSIFVANSQKDWDSKVPLFLNAQQLSPQGNLQYLIVSELHNRLVGIHDFARQHLRRMLGEVFHRVMGAKAPGLTTHVSFRWHMRVCGGGSPTLKAALCHQRSIFTMESFSIDAMTID